MSSSLREHLDMLNDDLDELEQIVFDEDAQTAISCAQGHMLAITQLLERLGQTGLKL